MEWWVVEGRIRPRPRVNLFGVLMDLEPGQGSLR